MSPEVPNMPPPALSRPEQTSPSGAGPPQLWPETTSTCQKVPEGMPTITDETLNKTPVDTAGTAHVNMLKGAAKGDDGVNAEDFYTAHAKTRGALWDDESALELLREERKSGDIRRRSKQAVMHLTFTEMRITQMEQHIRKLEAELHNKPEDFQVTMMRRQAAVYKSFIKSSSYGEFVLNPQSAEIPFTERASLETLVTEHGAPAALGPEHNTASHSASVGRRTHQQTPERLRIRYAPLIKLLEKISRETLSNHLLWPNGGVLTGVPRRGAASVLLRPWKFLVAYEKEIRDSVHNIDKLIEPAHPEDVSDGVAEKGVVDEFEYKREDLLREIKLLVEFLDVDLKPVFDLRRAIQEGTATKIEYGDLWHLFHIGDTVIHPHDKTQAYRVLNFTGGRDPLVRNLPSDDGRQPKPAKAVGGFAVDCCSLCFDGTSYVPVLKKFLIRKYPGRKPITALEVFPLKFDKDRAALDRGFEAQGHRYLKLTREAFSHRMFRGTTRDEPPQQLDAQVIVDVTLAINQEPDWQLGSRVSFEDFTQNDERETQMPPFCHHGRDAEGHCGSDVVFKDLTMNQSWVSPSNMSVADFLRPRAAKEDFKQEDLILLPQWVHAFVLRSRQWVTLNTEDLSEVQFSNNFDELMFSPEHKQTIAALVETHENARTGPGQSHHSVGPALDLVKGKGAGLTILLHGEPGVGKTSTAECVADKTKRPLFPITCGDIGESAMEVEKNLHHNFRLAYKWGCVLLLDEADVFLAKRNKSDLRRNAVTSVFLRSLEYYAGILFLTTNRVGSIDPAFKSRIQLSLYYPPIDLETTVKLYKVFLKRARDEQERTGVTRFKIKEKGILKFAASHFKHLKKDGLNTWNGRQIRNACQTAIALVEHEAAHLKDGQPIPVLGKTQFETVAKGTKEFDLYLKKTLHFRDDEIARRDQWRNDTNQDADDTRASSPRPAAKGSSSRKPPVMVSESEGESSDDSETDEDDDEDDGDTKPTGEGSKAQSDDEEELDGGEITIADFKKFKKIQALMDREKKK